MEHFLLDLASRYGYIVIFLGVGIESMGVPVPGETALVIGAVLSAQGRLLWPLVALAGWAGAVAGDNAGYALGRRLGPRLTSLPVLRHVYTGERVAAAERFFARHGWVAVFFGRFVALLRIFAGPLAGMHQMPWRRFVVANAAGGAVWVTLVVVVGLLLGSNLDRAVALLGRSGWAGLALAVVVAAILVVRHLIRGRGPGA